MSDEQNLDFDAIGENVLSELNRRLATPALAAELPGTLLMKLGENYLKYLERKEAQQGPEEEVRLTPLEIIDTPGLPIDKRLEILSEYLDKFEEEWRLVSKRMEELVAEARKEVEDGDPDQMS